MAAELFTPVDERTGRPLPIILSDVLPSGEPLVANRHHPWHPSCAAELDVDTLSGAALRRSGIQLVPAENHNIRQTRAAVTYHDKFIGPELPQTDDAIFNILVPTVAGFVPEEGLDPVTWDQRPLTPREMEILRTPAQPQPIDEKQLLRLQRKAGNAYDLHVRPNVSREDYVRQSVKDHVSHLRAQAGFNLHHFSYGYSEVRDFFEQYVSSRDISHVREAELEEFLTTPNDARRRYLGHVFLAKAVEVATHDVNHTYVELRKEGSLHPLMPRSARTLVTYKLGQTKRREKIALALADKLRDQVGLAA